MNSFQILVRTCVEKCASGASGDIGPNSAERAARPATVEVLAPFPGCIVETPIYLRFTSQFEK